MKDNYAAYKRMEIRDRQPADQCPVHPDVVAWLNLVEVWFGIIERQAILRGTFISVHERMTKIRASSTLEHPYHPFIWTKIPHEILVKIDRKREIISPPSLWVLRDFRIS